MKSNGCKEFFIVILKNPFSLILLEWFYHPSKFVFKKWARLCDRSSMENVIIFSVLMSWRLYLFMHSIIASSPVLEKIINSVSCFCNETSFVYIYIFLCTQTFILSETDECLNISYFLFIFNYLVNINVTLSVKSGFYCMTYNTLLIFEKKNYNNYFQLSWKYFILYNICLGNLNFIESHHRIWILSEYWRLATQQGNLLWGDDNWVAAG